MTVELRHVLAVTTPGLVFAADARYAQALYAALHAMDGAGCVAVVVERVPAGDAWEGVADRLQRAAAPLEAS